MKSLVGFAPSIGRKIYPVLLTAIALAAGGLVLYTTLWGPGLISDSFQYISAAENFAAGKGLGYSIGSHVFLMTHYPPMYPVALSPFALASIDTIEGARWLNALLIVFNTLLVGASLWVVTHSRIFSLLGAFLAAVSPIALGIHSWALSEPLYVCFNLGCLLCLGFLLRQAQPKKRTAWLLSSAILASLAFLTRYVGLALLLTCMLGIAWLSEQGWKRRAADLLAWGSVALLPSAAWMLRNRLLAGTLTDRALSFNLLTRKNLGMVVNTLATWFLPAQWVNGREKYLLAILVLLAIGLGLYVLIARRGMGIYVKAWSTRIHPTFWLHALQVPVYLGVILVSKSLFDEGIGMSDRILSPIYFSLLIVVVSVLQQVWSTKSRTGKAIALGVCAYLLWLTASGGLAEASLLHTAGPGGARARLTSEAISFLRSAEDFPIYTNSPASIYLRTGKSGLSLASFRHKLEAGSLEPDVYLVIFKHVPRGQDLPAIQETGVKPLVDDDVASIYLYHR